MSILTELAALNEADPMNLFDDVCKITEAYCIEHNLPCKRRFTHDELQDAFAAVREAHATLNPFYDVPLCPAEACTDVGESDKIAK